jgi:hypothetical protein
MCNVSASILCLPILLANVMYNYVTDHFYSCAVYLLIYHPMCNIYLCKLCVPILLHSVASNYAAKLFWAYLAYLLT